MADLRDVTEIENSFHAAVQVLDAAVEGAYAALARRGISVIDRSNRSGFDPSGYPNYRWEQQFRHEGALERCVMLEATATWIEPTLQAEFPGAVAVRANVVVFYPGQSPPLFASAPFSRSVPLEACTAGVFLEVVLTGLMEAAAALPTEYWERVADFQ